MVSARHFCAFLVAVVVLGVGGFCFFSRLQADVPLIPRMVLAVDPEKSHTRISPDGTKLAYLAPHNGIVNVWVKTIGTEDDRPVTAEKRRIWGIMWAYDNKHVLFVQDKNGDENFHAYKVDIKTCEVVDLTPFDGVRVGLNKAHEKFPNQILITMNKEDKKRFDVYLLDIASGDLKLVAKNPGNVDVWCSDENLVVRAAVAVEPDGRTSLLVRQSKEDEWKKIMTWDHEDSMAGGSSGSRPLRFSRDGNFLYLLDSYQANTKQLIKMDLRTGTRKVVAADDQYDIDMIFFNGKTGDPDFVSFVRARREWKALNQELKKDLDAILSLSEGDLRAISRSVDGTKWTAAFLNDDKPSSCYLYDSTTQKGELLHYDKPKLLEYELAKTKPISFQSRDGLTIHGYLTCPLKKELKNLPLVLLVHGGPWGRDTWGLNSYNVMPQLLSNRGYACLQVNFRGSTGYGKAFLNAGDKEWGGAMQNDLTDAVRWAIKEGIADPKKIAISGISYGGYAALCGAAFTPDLFCCAVSISGPTNLVTLIPSIIAFAPSGKTKWHRRVGNPETDRAFLESRSPVFKADQIKIPVFIVHGANDVRVKAFEAEEMVAALKESGVEHEYMLFPGEGHFITNKKNKLLMGVGIEKFLAKHLGGRFEPLEK